MSRNAQLAQEIMNFIHNTLDGVSNADYYAVLDDVGSSIDMELEAHADETEETE